MRWDKPPLVSIVTPVYNGAPYLEDLIRSVQGQDYPRIEHVIIDDGSNDDGQTRAVLERHPEVRWWSRDNKGQYLTINEGILACKGDIVGIICADDMYVCPSAVSGVIEFWGRHPGCDAVYGRVMRMDGSGTPIREQVHDFLGGYAHLLLRYYAFISHSSLFVARDVLVQEGILFDPSSKYVGDWEWMVRLREAGHAFGFLDKPLSLYRQHAGQTTMRSSMKARKEERARFARQHSISPIATSLAHAAIGFTKMAAAVHQSGVRGGTTLLGDWLRLRGWLS